MNAKSKATLEKLELKLRFQNYAESTIKTYLSYSKIFLNHFKHRVVRSTYGITKIFNRSTTKTL